MSLEAELTNLTLTDVLNAGGLDALYAIREEDYPFLKVLAHGAREAIRGGRLVTEIQGLQTAAEALRAIILAARTKPLPETERFLRETAGEEFFKAICGMRSRRAITEFSPPIVQEARDCQAGNGGDVPDELAGFVVRGLENVYPLLMWVAVVRAGDNLEDTI